MADEMRKDPLMMGIGSLLESGYFADLTITCGKKTWKVHKAIVCPQSEFFMKACTGNFAEAKLNNINLDDDDPDAVNAMITFFYQQHYDPSAPASQDAHIKEAYASMRVNILADKYNVKPLSISSLEKFGNCMGSCRIDRGYAEIVAATYREAPPHLGLRNVIVNDVAQDMHAFYSEIETGSTSSAFASATSAIPEFATDVLTQLAKNKRVA